MPHTPHFVVSTHQKAAALLSLCDALVETLPKGSGATQAQVARQLQAAQDELLDYESPFLRHRKVLLARSELQSLVVFLFDGSKISFYHLFSSLTQAEVEIALACIASYATNGENDLAFMRLAAEIFDLQKAAA